MVGPANREQATVRGLVVALFVHNAGASAVLPMLPLFLRHQHTSSSMIGVVIAAFFLAGVFTQYVVGHVTDRIGHGQVIVGGLLLYAAASAAFLFSVNAAGYAALRALQGLGSGALMVAGLSLVGVVVPASRRGRAFSLVFAAQLAGMAIGPLLGSIAGVSHIRTVFVFTACAAAAAIVPVVLGTPLRTARNHVSMPPLRVHRGLVAVVLIGVGGGVIAGAYESCWSLLMTSRGAAPWQIGMSWTLFAVPFAALSPVAGRLVDRYDRRKLATLSMVISAGFAAAYPFIPSPAVLIGLGSVESIGMAIAFPAAQALLSETAPAEALGRAQGLFTTAETGAIAGAAISSGWLFAQARWLPFVTVAALCFGLMLAALIMLRDQPGRAARAAPASPASDLSSGRQGPEPVVDVTVKA